MEEKYDSDRIQGCLMKFDTVYKQGQAQTGSQPKMWAEHGPVQNSELMFRKQSFPERLLDSGQFGMAVQAQLFKLTAK